MSPWWSDRIQVGLGTNRVDLVRTGRGLHPRVLASCSVPFAACESQSLLQAQIAAFRQGLDRVRVPGKSAACYVVLGNQWVRYQLIAWHDGFHNAQECQAYAELQFRSVYGALAEGWEIACGEARYGCPTLVCAIDKPLTAALRGAIAQSGLHLASMKPFLSSAMGRWRRKLTERDYWFTLIDGERMCLLNASNGMPKVLRVEPLRGDVTVALPAMVRRESIGLGRLGSHAPLYCYGPELSRDVSRALQEMRVRVLDAASFLAMAKSDTRYAMALT